MSKTILAEHHALSGSVYSFHRVAPQLLVVEGSSAGGRRGSEMLDQGKLGRIALFLCHLWVLGWWPCDLLLLDKIDESIGQWEQGKASIDSLRAAARVDRPLAASRDCSSSQPISKMYALDVPQDSLTYLQNCCK